MRYIYVDEAGIAKDEPVTVVVGIIVHADKQYAEVEKKLGAVLQAVPAKLRPGFVSHAKSILGNRKLRDDWPLQERLDFLKSMMSITNEANIPVSMAMVRRTHGGDPDGRRSLAEYHHALAFTLCVAHADRYVREHAGPEEIATVVAEDAPGMRPFLRALAKALRDKPIIVSAESRLRTTVDKAAGIMPGNGEYRISRVKDTIHFVAKVDGPLLQIADVCAYSFRRFLARQKWGEELVRVFYPDVVAEDFEGVAGSVIVASHPMTPVNDKV